MGKQVEIVSVGRDHTIQLNSKELERILLAPNVKDKPVAVVSIMGAFRQGKSFLMNFLMRYLRSHDKSNWMGEEESPLTGFSWSTGKGRNTQGINFWDELFLVPMPGGGELAVLLMDTQGAFDGKSSADETANLFALSILTSSVQIYNIFDNLQEDHLQHLQLVTEYGMATQEITTGSQFQKLVFLIRDWRFKDDNAYGAEGGREFLEEFMSTSAEQHKDNQDLRQCLATCFSSIHCFLMPPPGTESQNKKFDGRLSKLDSGFKQELKVLVPWLVASQNLATKTIAGKAITCKELLNYFTVYVKVFKDGKRPHVSTVLQATQEESHRNAKEEARAFYEEQISKAKYKNMDELEKIHKTLREGAIEIFKKARKLGGPDVTGRYLNNLEKEIKVIFGLLANKQQEFELERKNEEMRATSIDLSEKQKELKKKQKELQTEKQQLDSRSSDVSHEKKKLDEKEKKLEKEVQELNSKSEELRSQKKALDEEKRKLAEEKKRLMSEADILGILMKVAAIIGTAVTTVIAPPLGIAMGSVMIGALVVEQLVQQAIPVVADVCSALSEAPKPQDVPRVDIGATSSSLLRALAPVLGPIEADHVTDVNRSLFAATALSTDKAAVEGATPRPGRTS